MILIEKYLIKAMKADWKEDGYTVAGIMVQDEPWLAVVGTGYLAAVERSNAPRKMLATIAEHAGDLPGTGAAWLLQKGCESQLTDFDYTEALIRETIAEKPDDGLMVRTRMWMDTRKLWQNTASGRIWVMNPAKTNIADAPASMIEPTGPWIRFRGTVSVAAVCRETVDEADGKLLEHLEKVRWI